MVIFGEKLDIGSLGSLGLVTCNTFGSMFPDLDPASHPVGAVPVRPTQHDPTCTLNTHTHRSLSWISFRDVYQQGKETISRLKISSSLDQTGWWAARCPEDYGTEYWRCAATGRAHVRYALCSSAVVLGIPKSVRTPGLFMLFQGISNIMSLFLSTNQPVWKVCYAVATVYCLCVCMIGKH